MAPMTKRLSLTVTASAISVLFGTAAHGAYYPGKLDPGGTGTVPGFNGTAIFNIPNTCIPEGGTGWEATRANTGTSNGCGDASVYSANVNLYSTAVGDPPVPGVVLDQFAMGTSHPNGLPLSTYDIVGVYFLHGALDGVDTGIMGPVNGSSFYSSDQFWLQFVSGQCQFGCTPPGSFDPVYMYFNGEISNPGTVIFGPSCGNNPVGCAAPEPGVLGLIAGALGAGWLIRRRKSKTAPESS